MKLQLQRELRYLFPPWAFCVLLPMPWLLFMHSPLGRSHALCAFFLGGAILVAYSFRREVLLPDTSTASDESGTTPKNWNGRMLPLAIALLAAWSVFSSLSLLVNDLHDFVAPMLALMATVPAICIVPYIVLVTRNTVAGVVFTLFLVGSIKTPIGANLVATFFPDHFVQSLDYDGRLIMPMPWTHPNLLVWIFYTSTAAFSLLFYFLGARRFSAARISVPTAPGQ